MLIKQIVGGLSAGIAFMCLLSTIAPTQPGYIWGGGAMLAIAVGISLGRRTA